MENVKADAATMNALFSALGCVVMSITAAMTPEQRAQVAANLARLAMNAERMGDPLLEMALIDLQRAARG